MNNFIFAIALLSACGEAGIDGSPGANGLNGEDGTDNKIVASLFCAGQLQNTTLWFSYKAVLFSSGDVWAFADIRDAMAGYGGSSFYSVDQVGAATASVFVSNDEYGDFNGGWWELSVNRNTTITTIVYHDVDLTSQTMTWTMPSNKCVLNNY